MEEKLIGLPACSDNCCSTIGPPGPCAPIDATKDCLMTLLLEHGEIEITNAERRRGLRISQLRAIKVLDSLSGKYFGGQTRDISTTGLQIELPAHARVRTGEMLSIHVGLNESGQPLANRRQMIPARVVWISSLNMRRKTITAGVEFAASIGARLDAA